MKKIIYIIIIVLFIMTGVFIAKQLFRESEEIATLSNSIIENGVNEAELNSVIEPENNVIETEPEEQKVNNTNIVNKEEKAKKIVEENWGEDDSVYYSYDGKDENGNYIICVRDKATTKALFWYYVDVDAGTFDIK